MGPGLLIKAKATCPVATDFLLGSVENGSVGKSVCLASISLVSHTHGKRWACYFSTGEAGRPANLD